MHRAGWWRANSLVGAWRVGDPVGSCVEQMSWKVSVMWPLRVGILFFLASRIKCATKKINTTVKSTETVMGHI